MAIYFNDVFHKHYRDFKRMSVLPSTNNKQTRSLTEKQQAFLEHLVDTQGDSKKAADLAGYTGHYSQIVKALKTEILEITQEILANSAPKAAFKVVEIMEADRPVIQANNKLAAATTLLDRVGVSKVDKLDVTHKAAGGIFLMPDKAPMEAVKTEYTEIRGEE
tara:strand:+ start:2492 stop:2980 length:489 start_codon:yes stop_codon:yes gene_type:complete